MNLPQPGPEPLNTCCFYALVIHNQTREIALVDRKEHIKLMPQSEDIIWNTITDSAKTRFDYSSFETDFSEFHDGGIAENVLFLTILGHAQEEEIESIVSEISQQFLLLGLGGADDEIRKFVEARLSDLSLEINATKQALAFTEMGLHTQIILDQVKSILEEFNKHSEQRSDDIPEKPNQQK